MFFWDGLGREMKILENLVVGGEGELSESRGGMGTRDWMAGKLAAASTSK